MIEITDNISIHESELKIDFVQASGPGGQNVNKVATAVQLHFDVLHSTSLSEDIKSRLIKLAGKRMTQDGVLLIEAKRFRSEERKRKNALARFQALVQKATEKPKKRVKTIPTKAAQEARLKEKKHKGEIKRTRRKQSIEIE